MLDGRHGQGVVLGAQLLRLFFLTRVAVRPSAPQAADGTTLGYYDQRLVSYFSVFGKFAFPRHSFRAPGQPACCPVDAELSLPERCYSDLLRDWTGYDATDGAYRETSSAIARILNLDLSVQALETNLAADTQDVAAFYAQPASTRDPRPAGSILVVQADGKGVPSFPTSRWCWTSSTPANTCGTRRPPCWAKPAQPARLGLPRSSSWCSTGRVRPDAFPRFLVTLISFSIGMS